MEENRISTRYKEIGRVNIPELCALPEILENISATGCKVIFPISVVVNLEKEYMIQVMISRFPDESPLQLRCKPMWVSEIDGVTHVGFSILFSPDENRLHYLIKRLEEINEDEEPEIV